MVVMQTSAATSMKNIGNTLATCSTSWGGALKGTGQNWCWQIGCSHAHEFYQNPLAAYALLTDLNSGMKAEGATQDYKKSLEKVGVNAPETEEPVKKVVSDYARLFDIEIWYDDHKVEPAADVTVNIKLLDAPEETEATPQVVHFAKAGAELI